MWVIWVWLIWWIFALFKTFHIFVPLRFPWGNYAGMAVAPFILLDPQFANHITICHELRHIKQQMLLSPLGMLIIYWIASIGIFLFTLLKYRSLKRALSDAYWKNPFEKDAFNHQFNCNK